MRWDIETCAAGLQAQHFTTLGLLFQQPVAHTLKSFFPLGLPRATCRVRRESGPGIHKASDFVNALVFEIE